ncbi:hypothetical protein MMPV_008089 [Pyropia vietnamensis]
MQQSAFLDPVVLPALRATSWVRSPKPAARGVAALARARRPAPMVGAPFLPLPLSLPAVWTNATALAAQPSPTPSSPPWRRDSRSGGGGGRSGGGGRGRNGGRQQRRVPGPPQTPAALEEHLASNPRDGRSWSVLARLMPSTATRRRVLARGLAACPGNRHLLSRAAVLELFDSPPRPATAASLLSDGIPAVPKGTRGAIYQLLARALLAMGDTSGAAAALSAGIADEPSHGALYALAAEVAGNSAGATAAAQAKRAGGLSSSPAMVSAAAEAAADAAERAVWLAGAASASHWGALWRSWAWSEMGRGRYASAARKWAMSVSVDSTNGRAWGQLAQLVGEGLAPDWATMTPAAAAAEVDEMSPLGGSGGDGGASENSAAETVVVLCAGLAANPDDGLLRAAAAEATEVVSGPAAARAILAAAPRMAQGLGSPRRPSLAAIGNPGNAASAVALSAAAARIEARDGNTGRARVHYAVAASTARRSAAATAAAAAAATASVAAVSDRDGGSIRSSSGGGGDVKTTDMAATVAVNRLVDVLLEWAALERSPAGIASTEEGGGLAGARRLLEEAAEIVVAGGVPTGGGGSPYATTGGSDSDHAGDNGDSRGGGGGGGVGGSHLKTVPAGKAAAVSSVSAAHSTTAAWVWLALGDLDAATRQYDRADRAYRRAVAARPGDGRLWLAWGCAAAARAGSAASPLAAALLTTAGRLSAAALARGGVPPPDGLAGGRFCGEAGGGWSAVVEGVDLGDVDAAGTPADLAAAALVNAAFRSATGTVPMISGTNFTGPATSYATSAYPTAGGSGSGVGDGSGRGVLHRALSPRHSRGLVSTLACSLLSRSDLAVLAGYLPDALRFAEAATIVDPIGPSAWQTRGELTGRLHGPAAARTVYATGVAAAVDARAPPTVFSRMHHAWALAERGAGDRERAMDLLQQAVEWDPTYTPAWLSLAHMEKEAGRPDAAVAALSQAVAVDGKGCADDVATAYAAWARLEEGRGNISDARSVYASGTAAVAALSATARGVGGGGEAAARSLSAATADTGAAVDARTGAAAHAAAVVGSTSAVAVATGAAATTGLVADGNGGGADGAGGGGGGPVDAAAPLWLGWARLEERNGAVERSRELYALAAAADPRGGAWEAWARLEARRRRYGEAVAVLSRGFAALVGGGGPTPDTAHDAGSAGPVVDESGAGGAGMLPVSPGIAAADAAAAALAASARAGLAPAPAAAAARLLTAWGSVEWGGRGAAAVGRSLLRRAAALDPTSPSPHLVIGGLERASGNMAAARAALEAAAAAAPRSSAVAHARGALEAAIGNDAAALHWYAVAREANPGDALAYTAPAMLLVRSSDVDGSDQDAGWGRPIPPSSLPFAERAAAARELLAAATAASAVPADTIPIAAAAVENASGRPNTAAALLTAAASADPTSTALGTAAAAAAASVGDVATARRHYAAAVAVAGAAPHAAPILTAWAGLEMAAAANGADSESGGGGGNDATQGDAVATRLLRQALAADPSHGPAWKTLVHDSVAEG